MAGAVADLAEGGKMQHMERGFFAGPPRFAILWQRAPFNFLDRDFRTGMTSEWAVVRERLPVSRRPDEALRF